MPQPHTTVDDALRPSGSAPSGRTRLPWWISVLAIYSGFRLVGAALLAWASAYQPATNRLPDATDPRTDYFVHHPLPQDPGFLGMLTNWDGQWYWRIADAHYQSVLENGSIAAQWSWAFPPGYPMTVSAVMDLLAVPFPVAASLVSVTCGAIASLLIFELVHGRMGDASGYAAVALVNAFISAPLLQVAYSESMALALVTAAILLIDRGRYFTACVPLMALGLVRLVTPPFAVVAVAVGIQLWRRRNLDRRSFLGLGAVAALAVTMVIVWPLIAARVSGSTLANRAAVAVETIPLGWFGYWYQHDQFGLVLLVALLVVLAAVGWRRAGQWGVPMAAWAVAYPVYLFSVIMMTTGILRYLLLAFPLGLVWIPAPRWPRALRVTVVVAVCVVGVVAQGWWLQHFYVADDTGGRFLIP